MPVSGEALLDTSVVIPFLKKDDALRTSSFEMAINLKTVRRAMNAHKVVEHPKLEKILEADAWARSEVAN